MSISETQLKPSANEPGRLLAIGVIVAAVMLTAKTVFPHTNSSPAQSGQ